MTLYMLHLPIIPRVLMEAGRQHGLLDDTRSVDLGYLVHSLFARLWQHSAPKPFDIQNYQANGLTSGRNGISASQYLHVLAYAPFDVDAAQALARRGSDREALAAIAWDCSRSKILPRLVSGQRAGFRVRVCPTIRIGKHHPSFAHGAEVDPYVALIERELARGAPSRDGEVVCSKRDIIAAAPQRETVYRDWLIAHIAEAVQVETVHLTALREAVLWRRGEFRQNAVRLIHQQFRPRFRGRVAIERREAVFEGLLQVIEADRLHTFLARGIGRHRAFGFGMLLLRSASN